jgi:hypothetical protein
MTSAFYRTIVEFLDYNILDDLRKVGWTIEPAPACVYQHPPMDRQLGCRIESDGGRVEPLKHAKAGSA